MRAHLIQQDVARHSRLPASRPAPLHVLAKRFIQRLAVANHWGEDLHASDSHFSITNLASALCEPDISDDDPIQAMEKLLRQAESAVGADFARELRSAMNRITDSVRQIAEARPEKEVEPVVVPESTRRHQTFGSFDVASRRDITKKGCSGMEKLAVLRKVREEVDGRDTATFTNALRNFMTQTLNPILHCLQNHFDSDETAFLKAWETKKFRHSKFNKLCGGTGVCKLHAN